MPISKSLGKIQKSAKNKNIHPKGRKFKQLNRATLREVSILKKKLLHIDKRSNELMCIKFIQDIVLSAEYLDREIFTVEELKQFLQAYIDRDDQELELLKDARKPGRPTSNKQLLLESKKKQELGIFETGWYLPNLMDSKTVKNLRNWNGTFGGNNNIDKILVSSKN